MAGIGHQRLQQWAFFKEWWTTSLHVISIITALFFLKSILVIIHLLLLILHFNPGAILLDFIIYIYLSALWYFFWNLTWILRVTLYQKKTQKSKIFYVKYFTFCPKTRLIPPLWDTLGHKKKVKYFVSGGKNENIPPKHFIFFWNFTSRLLDFVLTSRQIRLHSFQITP